MEAVTNSTKDPLDGQGRTASPAPAAYENRPPENAGRWGKFRWRMTRQSWWHASYLLDYVLVIVGFVVGGVVFTNIGTYNRFIPPNDPELSYPHKSETVPVWAAILATVVGPIIIFAIYQIWARSVHDFHHATLGILEGFAFAVFFAGLIKIYSGKPRPNFFDSPNASENRHQGFVSGHAAISFSGMVFLSMWLSGKLGILKKTGGHVWQQLIIYTPLIAASIISLTRTRDYYHDFVDITAGALLGTGLAIFNYMLKYPPLWKKKCEIPKRRWYEPHRTTKEWADRYAAAELQPPV